VKAATSENSVNGDEGDVHAAPPRYRSIDSDVSREFRPRKRGTRDYQSRRSPFPGRGGAAVSELAAFVKIPRGILVSILGTRYRGEVTCDVRGISRGIHERRRRRGWGGATGWRGRRAATLARRMTLLLSRESTALRPRLFLRSLAPRSLANATLRSTLFLSLSLSRSLSRKEPTRESREGKQRELFLVLMSLLSPAFRTRSVRDLKSLANHRTRSYL